MMMGTRKVVSNTNSRLIPSMPNERLMPTGSNQCAAICNEQWQS